MTSRARRVLEAEIARVSACLQAMPDTAVQAGFADDYLDELETLKEELRDAAEDVSCAEPPLAPLVGR